MDASVDAGPMDASADASLDSGPDGGRDAGSGRYIDCASGPCPAPYVCALVGVRTYRCAFVQPDALCGGSLHQVVNDQWSSSRNNDICVCTEGPVCGATTTSWRPLLDDHNSADCTSVCGG
ncbi:MAG: hypothetical protein K8H88_00075, partial [Sandaracinaceae bacterium]|nr:hypothetical protein [Sandaracinaceae bacterium]